MSEALALSAFVTAVKSDSRRKREYRHFVVMFESLHLSPKYPPSTIASLHLWK